MNPLAVLLAQRIRAQRQLLEMSQAELARQTGIQRPNICRIERGEHLISLDSLARIARALDTTMSELLEGL